MYVWTICYMGKMGFGPSFLKYGLHVPCSTKEKFSFLWIVSSVCRQFSLLLYVRTDDDVDAGAVLNNCLLVFLTKAEDKTERRTQKETSFQSSN